MTYTKTVFKDYLNPPLSAEELNKMQDGIAEAVNNRIGKGREVTLTLLAEKWSKGTSTSSYVLELEGVTETSTQELLPIVNPSADILNALLQANIQDGGSSLNRITLIAYGKTPEINLPIRVILKGEISNA